MSEPAKHRGARAYYSPRDGAVFLDDPDLGGALGLAIKVDRVLWEEKTEYQRLHVMEAGRLGRLLVLDGVVQVSQFDQAAYHEMLVHVPMLSHPEPRRVLVIGGGDGGAVSEALKHDSVRQVVLVEIDPAVIQACRRWLPELASSLDDERVEVVVGDGRDFVAQAHGDFDVILVDSSDPNGPANPLFGPGFYQEVKTALRPGGLVAAQGESYHLYQELIRRMFSFLPGIFPVTRYYTTQVPTYNSGVIGFACGSLGPDPMEGPVTLERTEELGDLEYYTPGAHRAAFALPKPALELLPEPIAQAQMQAFC